MQQTKCYFLQKTITLFLIVLFSFSIYSCDHDHDHEHDDDDDDMTVAAVCDSSKLPIVMAHGFLGAGDTYAKHVARFVNNGYCREQLFTFDWNSLDEGTDHAVLLDAFIDEVLLTTGQAQVNLAGHSAGGRLGYDYLADSMRAKKVANYAHIGSFLNDQAAGNGTVPTLNLWSIDDMVITEKGDIEGATNVSLTGADHYEVATNEASFEAIYRFFNTDEAPTSTTIPEETNISLGGRALTFGENIPLASAIIVIHEVDPATGFRLSETPDATLISDEKGYWGPWEAAKARTNYEFEIKANEADARTVYYVREGATYTNHQIYFRTIPPPTSLAGLLLANLPQDDQQSVLVLFSSSKAVISGRDALSVNNNELSTPALSSADQSIIAYFLYDDGDQSTSAAVSPLFSGFPFFNGADLFFPTDTLGSININFNDRVLNVRNWRSDSDGPIVVVFE